MVWDKIATPARDASLYVLARKVDQHGSNSLIRADKIQLAQELGVQLRDLRVLDPTLACSYPSALFCRDKALIVNLEDINCIITTEFVLLKDVQDMAPSLFAEKLQGRCVPQVSETDCLEMYSNGTDTFCHRPFELKVLDLVLDLVRSRLLDVKLKALARFRLKLRRANCNAIWLYRFVQGLSNWHLRWKEMLFLPLMPL